MKKQLSKNDIWQLGELVKRSFQSPDLFHPNDRVELVDNEVYLINNRPGLIRSQGRLIPSLHILLEHNFLKRIVVDMGAVQFVTSGSDVFRPGCKAIDESIQKDEIVSIVDERHEKPLAVGIALMSGKDMKSLEKGAVVKLVHWVGDRMWEFGKRI